MPPYSLSSKKAISGVCRSFTDSGLMYYGSDLLEEAGFSNPPETWDELKIVWNELLFVTFCHHVRPRREHKPFIGGTSGFASIFTINYEAQATVAVVVMAPLVLLFQRRIFSGLTVGAVVG